MEDLRRIDRRRLAGGYPGCYQGGQDSCYHSGEGFQRGGPSAVGIDRKVKGCNRLSHRRGENAGNKRRDQDAEDGSYQPADRRFHKNHGKDHWPSCPQGPEDPQRNATADHGSGGRITDKEHSDHQRNKA